ncbi:MAG: hypothetical protein KZQ92_10435, partial [Candidatus Thiodiazotropha sp. (ex Lucinoma borealis)]|nr:hypothetical protein [Candidatus Thiodiazotropha sp. (ex Lucinoma borealis)]
GEDGFEIMLPGEKAAHFWQQLNPGNTTQWHCLENTTERYLILNGCGSVEVGELPAQLAGSVRSIWLPIWPPG